MTNQRMVSRLRGLEVRVSALEKKLAEVQDPDVDVATPATEPEKTTEETKVAADPVVTSDAVKDAGTGDTSASKPEKKKSSKKKASKKNDSKEK